MGILERIKAAITERNVPWDAPSTCYLSVECAFQLLKETHESGLFSPQGGRALEMIIMRRDVAELKDYFQSCTIYGLKVKVVDVRVR